MRADPDSVATPTVDVETQHRVEQFLSHEADLLDTFALEEWLDQIGRASCRERV